MNQKGVINILLIVAVVALVAVGAYFVARQVGLPKPTTAPSDITSNEHGTQQTNDSWKTYTDSSNRFSLQYPTDLKPEAEKVDKFQIDSVRFKSISGIPLYISIQSVNQRWPNLDSYLNDQFLASKGGATSPPTKVFSSGLNLTDVGNGGSALGGHKFVGKLSDSEFIVFAFDDESLIDGVLSSFAFGKAKNTESWKTYQSKKFGFAFSYPSDWLINDMVNVVDLSDYDINDPRYERGKPDGVKIQFVPSQATRKDFPQIITSETIDGGTNELTKKHENSSLVQYGTTKPGSCRYIIFHKNSDQQVCVHIFFKTTYVDQILSTFKFTN